MFNLLAVSLPVTVEVVEFITAGITVMVSIVAAALSGFIAFLIVKKAFSWVSSSFDDEPESWESASFGDRSGTDMYNRGYEMHSVSDVSGQRLNDDSVGKWFSDDGKYVAISFKNDPFYKVRED